MYISSPRYFVPQILDVDDKCDSGEATGTHKRDGRGGKKGKRRGTRLKKGHGPITVLGRGLAVAPSIQAAEGIVKG